MMRPMRALPIFHVDEDDSEGESDAMPSAHPLLGSGVLIAERYRLRDKIGRGRMASIWEADDLDLGRVVAIKFLLDGVSEGVVNRKRFDLEAKAAARLRTPFAVQIYARGTTNEVPFIVMERLYGEDLQERLERVGRLPLPLVGKIVNEAGRALRDAHSLGIIHRDLKPGNLFLSRHDGAETVKLLDFGVAKNTFDAEIVTRTGVIVGSPAYMSPEQISGDRTIDARTDLWSLGVIVYRALTGEKPFGGDMRSVMREVRRGRPRKPSSICPDLPPVVDRFLAKALATHRADRFCDASEFMAAFQSVVREALGDGSVSVQADARNRIPTETHRAEEPTAPRPSSPLSSDCDSVVTWRPPSDPGISSPSPRGDLVASFSMVVRVSDAIKVKSPGLRRGPTWLGAILSLVFVGALAFAIVACLR